MYFTPELELVRYVFVRVCVYGFRVRKQTEEMCSLLLWLKSELVRIKVSCVETCELVRIKLSCVET